MEDSGQTAARSHEATNVRLLYLGYYMALGSASPFISLYYQRAGLTGVQIGVLGALILVMTSVTAIPWGALADRYRLHHRILIGALVSAPIVMLLISRVADFQLIVPLVLAYAFVTAPIIPLLDSSALEVRRVGGITYGEMRVGGTVGWIVSVWLVGFLIQSFDVHWLFYAYAVFMALTLLYASFRPPRRGSIPIPVWSNLRLLLTNPSVPFFLVSIFLVAVGSGGMMSFFSLYLDGIGAGEATIGLAWAIAAASEIPVMLYAGTMMRRIGSGGLLKLAFFVYAVRWLLLSFIHVPTLTLAVQLLHGVSFAAFLTAGVTYLNERTPRGFSTTAQAVFNVVAFGLGPIVGSLWGGYLYDEAGVSVMLRAFSLLTAVGLLVFWATAGQRSTIYATDA